MQKEKLLKKVVNKGFRYRNPYSTLIFKETTMENNDGIRYDLNKKLMQKKENLERKLWNRGFGTEIPIPQFFLKNFAFYYHFFVDT